jgi:hypothetical protein
MVLSTVLQEKVAGKYSGFELVRISLAKSRVSLASSTSFVSKNFTGSMTCAQTGVTKVFRKSATARIKYFFMIR